MAKPPTKKPMEKYTPKPAAGPSNVAPSAWVRKNDKHRYIILGGIVALVAIAAFTYFNSTQDVGQSTYDSDQSPITFTDDEGNETIISDSAELAIDFPEGVPLYDNGTVTASARTSTDGLAHWVVGLHTNDDINAVLPQIKQALSQHGWTITSQFESTDSGYYATSNDKYELSVSFAIVDSGGTDLTYNVSEKGSM